MAFTGTDKQKIYKLNYLIKDKEQSIKNRRAGLKKHIINQNLFSTIPCTQCKRGMDRYLGEKQIENNRENAPICIPCIEGRPRK